MDMLREALEQLESALGTPVVPGELVSWTASVQQALTRVGLALRHELDETHVEQYETMREENLELERRVEQLEAEDQALLRDFEQLNARVQPLVKQAVDAEPEEAKLDEAVERVVDEGLQLVVRIRKQQTAIATWLQEAFDRDRGDV